MPRQPRLNPPNWSAEELDAARQVALARFVESWGKEGTHAYRSLFSQNEPAVRRLFALTQDLRDFRGEMLFQAPELLTAARYLGGPPVSADDLETLAGMQIGRRTTDAALALRVEKVLRAALDPIRLPWVIENRSPREEERHAAILWTTGIWTIEQLRTQRRTQSSQRQERAVAEVLRAAGYEETPRLRLIDSLDQLPRGTFMRETSVAGSKCDIPVRLHDGRLLAIECKVSNSALNSVKRLIRETGGKARLWQGVFGMQVLTAAVLSGVYKLTSLVDAQDTYGIAIFWQHDLQPLHDFVAAAKP